MKRLVVDPRNNLSCAGFDHPYWYILREIEESDVVFFACSACTLLAINSKLSSAVQLSKEQVLWNKEQ